MTSVADIHPRVCEVLSKTPLGSFEVSTEPRNGSVEVRANFQGKGVRLHEVARAIRAAIRKDGFTEVKVVVRQAKTARK